MLIKKFLPPDLKISNPDRQLYHIFAEDDCYALWAAYSAGRPLLLRGKTGTGKSQLAKAIAEQLGWAFVSETINGSTELSDLHYHFDAVGRLGEAQLQGFSQPHPDASNVVETIQERLNPRRFLSPSAFWWAYDWKSAEAQYDQCYSQLRPKPYKPDNWKPEQDGVVLLLDEIDKADPDLPNGLLETLGQYQFSVPYLSAQATGLTNPIQADPRRVLVVITTNEERELPTAFVRRCFVHTLSMEDSRELVELAGIEQPLEKRIAWLVERGRLHFGTTIDLKVYIEVARQLWRDHDDNPRQRYPAGLAEYIDLLKILSTLPHTEQMSRLEKIAQFALIKAIKE